MLSISLWKAPDSFLRSSPGGTALRRYSSGSWRTTATTEAPTVPASTIRPRARRMALRLMRGIHSGGDGFGDALMAGQARGGADYNNRFQTGQRRAPTPPRTRPAGTAAQVRGNGQSPRARA